MARISIKKDKWVNKLAFGRDGIDGLLIFHKGDLKKIKDELEKNGKASYKDEQGENILITQKDDSYMVKSQSHKAKLDKDMMMDLLAEGLSLAEMVLIKFNESKEEDKVRNLLDKKMEEIWDLQDQIKDAFKSESPNFDWIDKARKKEDKLKKDADRLWKNWSNLVARDDSTSTKEYGK